LVGDVVKVLFFTRWVKAEQEGAEKMIHQELFPFKLERTDEAVTSRSGLAMFSGFMEALGVRERIERYLPRPGSGRGYGGWEYVKAVALMLYGGGSRIDDLRELREDRALRAVCGMDVVPSSSAVGDWLRRAADRGGVGAMHQVNRRIARDILSRDTGEAYTLIVDPYILEANKYEAHKTYLGVKGYRPVVATLKELGVCVAHEFRAGNDNSAKLRVIRRAFKRMPKGKRIARVLLDAEYYSNDVMEYLDARPLQWAIGVDKDESVMAGIESIAQEAWGPLEDRDGVLTDREVAGTVHATNEGRISFRLVVIRWREPQLELFRDRYYYHAIATNMDCSNQEVVWAYNERANVENHIKELQHGFALDSVPCGEFEANAIWFAIGVMTYNLWIGQKLLTLPKRLLSITIQTMRWMLVHIPAKLVRHGRAVYLRLATTVEKYNLLIRMKDRCTELAGA
jgi:hypothetical protein